MDADVFVGLGGAHAQLCQFNDVWHCIGEAMTMVQTTNESWYEAEANRVAGEIAMEITRT